MSKLNIILINTSLNISLILWVPTFSTQATILFIIKRQNSTPYRLDIVLKAQVTVKEWKIKRDIIARVLPSFLNWSLGIFNVYCTLEPWQPLLYTLYYLSHLIWQNCLMLRMIHYVTGAASTQVLVAVSSSKKENYRQTTLVMTTSAICDDDIIILIQDCWSSLHFLSF